MCTLLENEEPSSGNSHIHGPAPYCWALLCYFSLVCVKESLPSVTLPLDPGGKDLKSQVPEVDSDSMQSPK